MCRIHLFEIAHHAIRSSLLDRRRPQRTQNDSDVFPTNPPNRREQPNWSGGAQSSVDTSSFIHVSSEPSETSSPPSTIPLASRHLTGQSTAPHTYTVSPPMGLSGSLSGGPPSFGVEGISGSASPVINIEHCWIHSNDTAFESKPTIGYRQYRWCTV